MPQAVDITVRTQLKKIVDDLAKIGKANDDAMNSLKDLTEKIDESVDDNLKKTEKGVSNFGKNMQKVVKGLKEDFKALMSVQALGAGMKLSNTMQGSVKDMVKVSDAVRKMSGVFKIAGKDQASFVSQLTKGLGDVGLGGEAAANALEGLRETQVRGGGNLTAYAKTAGQLASVGGQAGQEGAIAKALAEVVQSRGRNVNDPKEMAAIAEAVNRTRGATGKSPTEILGSMQALLSSMNDNQKKRMTPEGLTRMATVAAAGGQGSTAFFQRYLSMNQYQRAGLDALGGGKLFSDKGLDTKALSRFMGQAKSLGGGDVNAGLEILGLTDEETKGLKTLYDNLETVKKATDEAAKSTATLADTYEQSKTLGEAFRGNFDRLKSTFAKPIGYATGAATRLFNTTQKSDLGAATVAVGSAVTAAALTRFGLGGVGSALGLKGAQEQVLEAKGEKVVPVRVVNVAEMSGGIGGIFAKSGALGVAGKVGGGIGALAGGLELGGMLRETETGGKISDAIADGILNVLQKVGVGYGAPSSQRAAASSQGKIKVELEVKDKTKDLKTIATHRGGPSVGAR